MKTSLRWPHIPVLHLSNLQWALLISLAFHAAMLSLTVSPPIRPERMIEDSPLEIVLVNARTRSRDTLTKPQALAQSTLLGGGSSNDSARARAPLPHSPLHQMGQHLDTMEQQVTALQTQQSQLLAQVKAQLAQLPTTQQEMQHEATQARAWVASCCISCCVVGSWASWALTCASNWDCWVCKAVTCCSMVSRC